MSADENDCKPTVRAIGTMVRSLDKQIECNRLIADGKLDDPVTKSVWILNGYTDEQLSQIREWVLSFDYCE